VIVTVRLSSFSAIAVVLALGGACGGRTVDGGNEFVGPSTAGQSSGGSSAGGDGARTGDGTGGVVSQNAGAGGRGGSGGGGSGGGGTSGVASSGRGASASAGASHAGAPSNGGAGANTAGGGSAAGTSGDSGSGSTSPPIPATWDTVKLVLSGTRPPCSGCHGMGDGGFRITLTNDSQLFKNLTTTVVKDCGNNPIITPGDPSKSSLLEIIQGDCSMKTPRMPPGCVDGDAGCVPPEYVAALSQWISDGAPWP